MTATGARYAPSPRLDVDEVRSALTTRDVLEHYGWDFRRGGSDELESSACPARADHSRRRCFVINANTGRWRCFSCQSSGDLFDVVAERERLDVTRDFAGVLAIAAGIAGVGPSTLSEQERAARRQAALQRRAEVEARERADREELERLAIPKASIHWLTCTTRDQRGEAYLATRGLAAAAHLCRFDPRAGGSPALPLRTRDGRIRNVVRRLTPEAIAALPEADRDRKTPGLYRCPTAGTLIGSLRDIAPGRLVVATEGWADSATATLVWPGAVVLGAHGADNMPAIIRAAARCCRVLRLRLLVVEHADDPGRRAVAAGVAMAEREGLDVRGGQLEIVEHPEKDLNDAVVLAGWRPL